MNKLLDHLLGILGLKNDAALARVLDCDAPVVSLWRHRRRPLGAVYIIRIHEASGMSVADIKAMVLL